MNNNTLSLRTVIIRHWKKDTFLKPALIYFKWSKASKYCVRMKGKYGSYNQREVRLFSLNITIISLQFFNNVFSLTTPKERQIINKAQKKKTVSRQRRINSIKALKDYFEDGLLIPSYIYFRSMAYLTGLERDFLLKGTSAARFVSLLF